jgi:hypothetical protein
LKRDSCSPDTTLRSQEERVVEGGRTEVAMEQRGLRHPLAEQRGFPYQPRGPFGTQRGLKQEDRDRTLTTPRLSKRPARVGPLPPRGFSNRPARVEAKIKTARNQLCLPCRSNASTLLMLVGPEHHKERKLLSESSTSCELSLNRKALVSNLDRSRRHALRSGTYPMISTPQDIPESTPMYKWKQLSGIM